ncbi:aminotransferase class IV [Eubacteriaceae bacterium ES3]|nr:aminotransferase class IV [Eubacteriaceae bacterium ES3]
MERGFVEADPGYLYGYGLFETINVQEGNMEFYHEHMERLIKSSPKIGLAFKNDPFKIEEDCYRLIRANRIRTGALRVTFSKGKRRNNLFITARENPYGNEEYRKGIALALSQFRRNEESLLVSLKSNNYLENLLHLNKAKSKGFNEVIFLNTKGKLSEGSLSNIFFIKDQVVCTPAEDCGILPGIMREKVLEVLEENKITCEKGYFTLEELLGADEVFVTNSLMEIMPVHRVDEKSFKIGLDTGASRIRTLYYRKFFK